MEPTFAQHYQARRFVLLDTLLLMILTYARQQLTPLTQVTTLLNSCNRQSRAGKEAFEQLVVPSFPRRAIGTLLTFSGTMATCGMPRLLNPQPSYA